MTKRQPQLGDTVEAEISLAYGGTETVRGVVIEVLDQQFVVQAPDKDGAITKYANGYRFVMNKDEWRVCDEE